jgi:hypothetical protein
MRIKLDLHQQQEFPSTTHQSIWHAAVLMAPFYEVIPPQVTGQQADALRAGEKNFYQFMTDLYADMYAHPDVYALPVGEYDRFMSGRDRNHLVKKEVQKESRLRNKFQQAIQFYQKLLFEIGVHGELSNRADHLKMDQSVLANMTQNHKFSKLRGEEVERMYALRRLGLEMSQTANTISISNHTYPHILMALAALCTAPNKKFALTHFLRCDFRGLLSGHQPGFDDATSILPDNFKSMADEMETWMQSLNCNIVVEPLKNTTLHSYWEVSYRQKGKPLYAFHADTSKLDAFAYFNQAENVGRMGYLVKAESDQLYTWFDEHIPVRECACRNNRLVDIGGEQKRICGLMNRMDVVNPNQTDWQHLKQIVAIYRQEILCKTAS